MTSQYQARWITIAGNSKRIKEGTPPPHWRCEIEGEEQRQLLSGWTLRGQATPANNTQGTKPTATGDEFLAWVSYYGNISIHNQHATIDLLPSPANIQAQ